jgi:PadR family transcriptional regulator, regulatory protein PadR
VEMFEASILTGTHVLHTVRLYIDTFVRCIEMFTSDNFPRLSHKEFVILEMLTNKGEMYGLEMVSVSEGELKRGTIYVTLQRMAEKNFVESKQEFCSEASVVRRIYTATDFGEKIFKAQELALRYLNMNVK